MIQNLQAVFFDFDGVICDSVNIKTEAFASLYQPYGANVVEKVIAYHLKHGGLSRYEKIRHYETLIKNSPPAEETINKLASDFSELVLQKVISSPYIIGAVEALTQLHSEYPLFIVSGTPQEELRVIAREKKINHLFKEINGSPQTKHEIITDLLARYNLRNENCVMIGDAMTDYTAAKLTGVNFIGVNNFQDSPFPKETTVLKDLTFLMQALN